MATICDRCESKNIVGRVNISHSKDKNYRNFDLCRQCNGELFKIIKDFINYELIIEENVYKQLIKEANHGNNL